jgi:cytoskeletal protein CcmA (bactofilin family)
MLNEESVGTTILSADAIFDGKAHVEGQMTIKGKLSGEAVCSGSLSIEEGASVEADLQAQDVMIGGSVIGNIDARNHVVLGSTARFQGEIKAAAIIVEDGATLRGTCITKGSFNF